MFHFALYAIIEAEFLGARNLKKTVLDLIAGGVDLIQLRDKENSTREFVREALILREVTKEKKIPFLINDRVDIALAVKADGVHLGQDDLPVYFARKLLKEKIIGVTVHNLKEAKQAEKEGADYLAVGSIFPTMTKKDIKVVGLKTLRQIKKESSLPLIAIGGIKLENVVEAMKAGADGVAIVSGLLEADDLTKRAREFKKLVNKVLKV
ncbi:MAG: thiamine phosphate synthase [Candidatus Edwardsbacteria bacterium]